MKYDKLLEQQRKFFYSGVTKEYSYRVNALKALRESLIYYEGEINQALMDDLGKSPYETFITEYGLALRQISRILRDLKGWMKPRVKSVGVTGFPGKACELVEPYGLTLIISPWNYPLSLAIQPLIGAIAVGNCAVVKPSELSPYTSDVIEKILGRAFPKEYVVAVPGGKEEANSFWSSGLTISSLQEVQQWGVVLWKKRRVILPLSPWNWAERVPVSLRLMPTFRKQPKTSLMER